MSFLRIIPRCYVRTRYIGNRFKRLADFQNEQDKNIFIDYERIEQLVKMDQEAYYNKFLVRKKKLENKDYIIMQFKDIHEQEKKDVKKLRTDEIIHQMELFIATHEHPLRDLNVIHGPRGISVAGTLENIKIFCEYFDNDNLTQEDMDFLTDVRNTQGLLARNRFRLYSEMKVNDSKKRIELGKIRTDWNALSSKQKTIQFDQMSFEDSEQLNKLQEVEFKRTFDHFKFKYSKKYYIPAFLHKNKKTLEENHEVDLHLRLFTKIRSKHFQDGTKDGKPSAFRTAAQNQRRKEILQKNRRAYDFHPSFNPPIITDVLRSEYPNEEFLGRKPTDIIQSFGEEEKERINKILRQWKQDYHQQNEKSSKLAIKARDWLALRRTEIDKYGKNKDLLAYKDAWRQIFPVGYDGGTYMVDEDGQVLDETQFTSQKPAMSTSDIFEKIYNSAGDAANLKIEELNSIQTLLHEKFHIKPISTAEERRYRIKVLKFHRSNTNYNFHPTLRSPNAQDILREDMKNEGIPTNVKSLNLKWDSLSVVEQSKYKKRAVNEIISYNNKNFKAIKRAIQNKDWLALQASEVKKNGAERDVFHYEQAWEKAMYPDMMAEYMLAGNEMFGPIKSVAIRKTYQPKKKLSKTQKEGGKIANDTLSESILKKRRHKYLFSVSSSDNNEKVIREVVGKQDWLALTKSEILKVGTVKDYIQYKYAWQNALK